MKQILAGLLALGTAYGGYTAYKADKFTPLLTEVRTQLSGLGQSQPASSSTNVASSTQASPTFNFDTPSSNAPAPWTGSSTDPLASGAAPVNYASAGGPSIGGGYTYAELLRPHLEFAFSRLEADRGRLLEDPLLRLREIIERDREHAEAREALLLLDRIRAVLREREVFRARIDDENAHDDFFRRRAAEEWFARARFLVPDFQRSFGDLFNHERLTHHVVPGFAREVGREVVARNEFALRPRFEDHGRPASFDPSAREDHLRGAGQSGYQNPLGGQGRVAGEHYQNPLEGQSRVAGEHYHNPLEAGGPTRLGETSSVTSHSTGTHQTGTTGTNPQQQQFHPTTTGANLQQQSHPTTTGAPTTNRPPVVVSHSAPPPPPPPVAIGGGA